MLVFWIKKLTSLCSKLALMPFCPRLFIPIVFLVLVSFFYRLSSCRFFFLASLSIYEVVYSPASSLGAPPSSLLVIYFLVACYATLHPSLLVRWSVCRLVHCPNREQWP